MPLLSLVAALSLLLPAHGSPGAAPLLPRIFAPEMVLPSSPNTARVWGWSAPGDAVNATVTCAGKVYAGSGIASAADGLWVAALPPISPVFGCRLEISSANWTANVSPVHFGAVLFCGGQSNQHLPLTCSLRARATPRCARLQQRRPNPPPRPPATKQTASTGRRRRPAPPATPTFGC